MDQYLGVQDRTTYHGAERKLAPRLYDVYALSKHNPHWRFIPDGNFFSDEFNRKLMEEVPGILKYIDSGI
jgi:hypothetical protein